MSLWPIERPHLGFRGSAVQAARLCAILLAILAVGIPLLGSQAPAPKHPAKRTPLELLQAAHTLFLQKDYEAAREYYLEVLPSYPRNFDVLKNLAFCYYKRGPKGYAQAASYYSRAYEINPGSAEVVENLSRCLLGLNRAGEAAAIYQKMAEQPGAPATAWKRTAEAYDAAGRPQQAEAAYDAYLQRNAGDLDARAKLGALFAREKAYAKAQEQYRMVLSANPNNVSALIGMARLSAWQGQYPESLRLYDRVLRLDPSNAEAEVGKAFVLLWADRYEEAQALFAKLHQRHPRDSEIARGLEQAEAALRQRELAAARRSGDTARIEAFYRERLRGNPNDIAALQALAEATATPARCSESIEFSRRGLELNPTDTDLELRLARSMVLCQQYAEAIARYQHVLAVNPKAEGALSELGFALLRARRNPEAIEAFRKVLQINPTHSDASMGLALALASNRDYQEALLRYDEILKRSPDNYDAWQGKAYVLYWMGQYAQARAIFQDLAAKRPDDAQNPEALKGIASAEEEAKWAALRPASGAPPQNLLAYCEKRLAAYPDDLQALKGRAYAQAQLNNFPAAIQAYRQVLEKYPDDHTSKMELARLLAREGQYDGSIRYYREVLKDAPDDLEALESLGRVYVWSKQDREALPIYQGLLARNPANNDYRLEVARIQLRLQDYAAARQALTAVLAADPQNRDAHLELARLELRQGDRAAALPHFDAVLKQDPKDSTALLGKAQIAYFQGDLPQAYTTTSELVAAQPDNFDAVFLLANIEHARRHRRKSLDLLDRAAKLSPGNSEILAMRQRLRQETAVTLRTSASYGREIGPPSVFVLKDAVPPSLRPIVEDVIGPLEDFTPRTGLPNEDLRFSSYGTTIGFSVLPRTDSNFSLSYLPSVSPPGPRRDDLGNQLPTGITGAVGPAQFLYRQTTRLSSRLTVRAGAGLVRFGPGVLQNITGQRTGNLRAIADVFGMDVLQQDLRDQIVPDHTAEFSPLAQAGLTIAPTKKFSFDLDATRSAINYTPLSARLGVIQERIDGGLNFFFTPRTALRLDYFYSHYSSKPFQHFDLIDVNITKLPGSCPNLPLGQCILVSGQLITETKADHDQAHGGAVNFIWNLVKSDRVSFDAGYEGVAYGFAGDRRHTFMGFFNPSFYQQHLLTAGLVGKFYGPFGYDFSGGIGLRQSGQGEALTRALRLSPTFTFKVSDHFSFGIGYSHYTTAQALGPLSGNVARLTTEWTTAPAVVGAPAAQVQAQPVGGARPAQVQARPLVEIFVGPSLLCYGCQERGRELFGGWQASVSTNFRRNIGITGDFGGQYRSWFGVRFSQYEYMVGPRLAWRFNRTTPFVHALFGGVTEVAGGIANTGLGMGFGGGLDVNVSNRLAIRAVQFDYIPNHFNLDGIGGWDHDLRLGVGLVIKAGSSK